MNRNGNNLPIKYHFCGVVTFSNVNKSNCLKRKQKCFEEFFLPTYLQKNKRVFQLRLFEDYFTSCSAALASDIYLFFSFFSLSPIPKDKLLFFLLQTERRWKRKFNVVKQFNKIVLLCNSEWKQNMVMGISRHQLNKVLTSLRNSFGMKLLMRKIFTSGIYLCENDDRYKRAKGIDSSGSDEYLRNWSFNPSFIK